MKRKLLTLVLLAAFFIGCQKDGETSSSTKENFTVKYELIASSPLTGDLQGFVTYTNGTGQMETVTDFTSGTTWTKTITVTTETRPLTLWLQADNPWSLASPGSLTGNIYVNGVKKASTTQASITVSGKHAVFLNTMTYAVQ